jgi:hypothetical protein
MRLSEVAEPLRKKRAELVDIIAKIDNALIALADDDGALDRSDEARREPDPFVKGPAAITSDPGRLPPFGKPIDNGVTNPRVQLILRLLSEEGPMSTREIAMRLGEPRLLVKTALHRLKVTGKLTKIGQTSGARWAIPEIRARRSD